MDRLLATYTLTCTADLDPAIDIPVTVNIQLRDPAGRTLTTTTPSVSGSTYSSMATISSFGRDQSGLYTCSATVSPSPPSSFLSGSSSRSGTLRVTTGGAVILHLLPSKYAHIICMHIYTHAHAHMHAHGNNINFIGVKEMHGQVHPMLTHRFICP